jgi:hypothetical protein
MMGIKCGAQFRVGHALAAMNSVRGVLPGPHEKVVNYRG